MYLRTFQLLNLDFQTISLNHEVGLAILGDIATANDAINDAIKTNASRLMHQERHAVISWFEQRLVARHQTHFSYKAKTTIDERSPTSANSQASNSI